MADHQNSLSPQSALTSIESTFIGDSGSSTIGSDAGAGAETGAPELSAVVGAGVSGLAGDEPLKAV